MKGDATKVEASLAPLITRVGSAWDSRGRAPEAFTAIAEQELKRARLHESLDMSDVLAHLAETSAYPRQHDRHLIFGEPPVTIARGEGFHVDAYFWVNPSTSVHNHIFSGAFTVLHGVSLHVAYAFAVSETFEGGAILTGSSTAAGVELLRAGAVRAIGNELQLVHRVAHLSRPTLSVVVRTSEPPPHAHAYTFLLPALAVVGPDRLAEGPRRQLEVARLLSRTPQPQSEALMATMIARAGGLHRLWLLRTVFFETWDLGLVTQLAEAAPETPWLGPALESFEQAASSLANWQVVVDEGHRLFVALTASTADRAEIARIIEEYSGTPAVTEQILAWTREMSERGLTGFLPSQHLEAVLRALLEGGGADEAATALARALGLADSTAVAGQIPALIEHLSGFPPLRPFLRSH